MSDAWKELDLAGGGLQRANIRLAALLRKRSVARALLVLFPLGLHRSYLHDRRGAWLYRSVTLLGVVALLLGQGWLAGLALAAGAAFAVRDLVRMEDAVARVNKKLRMDVYLSQAPGAPPGFRGRYTDGPQAERDEFRGGEPGEAREARTGERAPSFAEQEKRLRLREPARAREEGEGRDKPSER
jgi:hypothetical protein